VLQQFRHDWFSLPVIFDTLKYTSFTSRGNDFIRSADHPSILGKGVAMPVEKESANISVVEKKDAALIAAWRRFLDYDRVSSQQKRDYQKLRGYVITLGLFTSAGAVFSGYVGQIPWIGNEMQNFLRLALIIMPIISVAMMNYASQFASSTAWVEYRVGAEKIRSQIYLYRLKAGGYGGLTSQAAQQKLLDSIQEFDQKIDEQGSTLPYMGTVDDTIYEQIAAKTDDPAEDKGTTPITVEQYLKWRVRPQINWYIHKIQNDYSKLQRERILALVVAGAGSVISGLNLGLESLVAVTTAMGVSLTLLSETRMYGATYGIFHYTAGRLQIEMNRWEILTDQQKTDPMMQIELVTRIEDVFDDERELWRAQAVQAQSTTDQAISSQIQKTISPEQIARFRQAGLPLLADVETGEKPDQLADKPTNIAAG
jgi:hypothetical protein